MLRWALVVLVVFASGAAGQPAVSRLLGALGLTSYPPDTRAPDFAGHTTDGQAVSLAGLRGRVVILNFWASWCLECRPEMPQFEELHRDFARDGLTVVGLNVREGVATVRGYAQELGLTFPLVLDPKGAIQTSYGVVGLPTTFLIARDGRVIARAIGPRDWSAAEARALIQALLAEPARPAFR